MSGRSKLSKMAILLVIFALAVLIIRMTSLKESGSEVQQILPVEITQARQGSIEKRLRISGFIESDTMVTVLPRIGGILTEIYVEMGDAVEEDQIIALIDSEPYQLSFNQAKAAFLTAESTFNRISSLYSSKSVSQQNYEEAKANYDTLKSAFELAELNLSYTELRAPVKGVILEKHVSRGSMVAPQVPVLTMGDIDNLKVNGGVPELHFSFFQNHREDMDILITVPALENSHFKGVISNIAPFISPRTRNFTVKCRVIDEESLLRPGMFVYLDFVLEKRENIYSLPYAALSGGDTLWFADDSGIAGKISFSPVFGNEEFFQIPEEFAEYLFITEGHSFLDEGQTVRIPGDQ